MMQEFVDCHVHIASGHHVPRGWTASDTTMCRHLFLKTIECYGALKIKALRDGGDRYGAGSFFKAMAEDAGITFATPICAVRKAGCYGDFLGPALAEEASITMWLDALFRRKPDFIKIIQTGIMGLKSPGLVGGASFTSWELRDIIKKSHDAGYKTMVHVNDARYIMEALEAGIDSIEHGYDIDDDCITALLETGCVWVPTLAPFGNFAKAEENTLAKTAEYYFERHQIAVRKAWAMGVSIAVGSDAGAAYVFHGQGTLDEWKYLMDLGIPQEVLMANSWELARWHQI
ncbi:MAG: amidohydrolase family protein [Eubacterium aggregans]